MRRLRIGILDLVTNEVPMTSLYGRVMNANLASIMPQVLGVWYEQAGHDVRFVCATPDSRISWKSFRAVSTWSSLASHVIR